jgi:hypothetical protein
VIRLTPNHRTNAFIHNQIHLLKEAELNLDEYWLRYQSLNIWCWSSILRIWCITNYICGSIQLNDKAISRLNESWKGHINTLFIYWNWTYHWGDMILLYRNGWLLCCVCVYEQRMKNFDMLRLTNAIGDLYTCTGRKVLLMGERITANTRKLRELCQYKVG